MPKFIVHRTINQQIAIESGDAEKADTEATDGKGEVIEHSTSQRVQADNRPASRAQAGAPGTASTTRGGK